MREKGSGAMVFEGGGREELGDCRVGEQAGRERRARRQSVARVIG